VSCLALAEAEVMRTTLRHLDAGGGGVSMAKRLIPASQQADRALCPRAVAQVLGLKTHAVAEGMRQAGVTGPLTLQQARSWKRQPEPPGLLAPLFAAAAARAARRADRAKAAAIEDEHRALLLEDKVQRRLLAGARNIRGADAEPIAADLAFRAMKVLVQSNGDTECLDALGLAALKWAGVEPSDRRTWFLEGGSR
jgi:hypothetical protein